MPNDTMNFGVDLLPLRDKEDNNGGFNLGSSTKKWNIFGDITGNATNDSEGNTINTTYLKKSGGQMTGDIILTSSHSDITASSNNRISWKTSNDSLVGYIAMSTSGGMGIHGADAIYLRPGDANGNISTSTGIILNNAKLYPYSTNSMLLGDASHIWENVYAATFTGDLSGTATNASNIATKLATTTKLYLLGSSTEATSTSTASNVATFEDTGIYITTTAGELSAVKYSINASGTEKVRLEYNSTDQSLDFIFI